MLKKIIAGAITTTIAGIAITEAVMLRQRRNEIVELQCELEEADSYEETLKSEINTLEKRNKEVELKLDRMLRNNKNNANNENNKDEEKKEKICFEEKLRQQQQSKAQENNSKQQQGKENRQKQQNRKNNK